MTKKRDLFSELIEGLEALSLERQGKITLRQHKVEIPPLKPVSPEEIRQLREKIGASRSVMAFYLRTNDRTLERWEQGRSVPNEQATALIKLVEKYPDMIERLLTL